MSTCKNRKRSRELQIAEGAESELLPLLCLEKPCRVLVAQGTNKELVKALVSQGHKVDVVNWDEDVRRADYSKPQRPTGISAVQGNEYDIVFSVPRVDVLPERYHQAMGYLREGGRLVVLYQHSGLGAACRRAFTENHIANYVVHLRNRYATIKGKRRRAEWILGEKPSYFSYILLNWIKGTKAHEHTLLFVPSQIEQIKQAALGPANNVLVPKAA